MNRIEKARDRYLKNHGKLYVAVLNLTQDEAESVRAAVNHAFYSGYAAGERAQRDKRDSGKGKGDAPKG